ncbi:homeobox protein engrailed-like SMOX-2 [Ruditapes philippinarum]|uniref:homeobox protein engrailed-like SMOX-2 n=1 Tax=Ruditapes philippinarum TaxID=129788 RepID=UPI00295BFCDA|nr:homeobox protein engrailed-like SMOX-2 [Ruditapes philippinarum]
MYLQSGNVWHSLNLIDARRLLELQQYQMWVEKQQRMSICDPFEPIRRLAMVEHGSKNPGKPLTSFRINDILADTSDSEGSEISGRIDSNVQRKHSIVSSPDLRTINKTDKETYNAQKLKRNDPVPQKYEQIEQNIIRPWNYSPKSSTSSETDKDQNKTSFRNENRNYLLKLCNKSRRCEFDSEDEEEIDVEGCEDEVSDGSISIHDQDVSPLDALMAMSSKAFIGLDNFDDRKNREDDQHGKSQIPKKKRKTRTAFTNQQIYELEKRFILQKYLTPSDRDEIAAKLGLSCAQVITWFQNRRAKFKRDIEEMKNDVVTKSPPPRMESDNEGK